MPSDFYELLEVPPDAAETAIDAAFREKAREYHPDRNDHEQATEQFQVLKKAHEVLSDPDERTAYDRLGHDQYVANCLGGLPGIDVVSSSAGGHRSQSGGQSVGETGVAASAGQPSSRTNGGGRRVSSATSSGRRRRRKYYRTTPGSPPGPSRVTTGLWLVGVVCYGLGIGVFVHRNRPAVEALMATVLEDGFILADLTTEALSLSRSYAFTAAAVSEGSIAMLFPAGAVFLALATFYAAQHIRDTVAWGVFAVSLVPLVGLGLAWLSSGGVFVLPSAVAHAPATILVFFVLGPLGTIGGWLWLVGRGRRL